MASRQDVELLLHELRNDPKMKAYGELFDFISEDLNNPHSEITPCQARQKVVKLAGEASTRRQNELNFSNEEFRRQYEKNCHKIADMLYNLQK